REYYQDEVDNSEYPERHGHAGGLNQASSNRAEDESTRAISRDSYSRHQTTFVGEPLHQSGHRRDIPHAHSDAGNHAVSEVHPVKRTSISSQACNDIAD